MKKPTKAQRKAEQEFCDLIAAHLTKAGAKQTRPAYTNMMGKYSPGEYDIETRVGTLHVHPVGSTVFTQFKEPERAMRLVSVSSNGKWNHHYNDVDAAKAAYFNNQLDSLLTGPKLFAKEPEQPPPPDPALVAVVRRTVPELGSPEQGPKTLTFFQIARRRFQIGRSPGMVAMIQRYGISCDFSQPDRVFVGPTVIDSHGDHYQMPSFDVIQRNGTEGISEKAYGKLYSDLSQKIDKIERALDRKRASDRTRKKKNSPPVRKLGDRGPVLSHRGCPPRCGKFHSLEEHAQEPLTTT